jgi:methyltransferase (TIGR00027 family)
LAHRAGLIDDPFAEPLVRATGELALRGIGGSDGLALLTDLLAVRTRFFDNFLTDACRAGIRHVVILSSGLDARPYRLWWPGNTTVYFKTQTMRGLGAAPTANRRAVGVDLRRDWPDALQRIGFDADQPTVWIAEGLFIGFLPPALQDRLLDEVTALSAPGSRAAADYFPQRATPFLDQEQALAHRWRQFGCSGAMAEFTYAEEHSDPAILLAALGWRTVVTDLHKLFTLTGLPGLPRQDLNGAPECGRQRDVRN